MNWINNVVRPRIRSFLKPKDTGSENLWVKDARKSGEMVFYRDLEANQWVVPNSGYHMKIKASDRLATFLDDGLYETSRCPAVAQDPLKFRDSKRYTTASRKAAPRPA
jgi:acetyl-CoA carboxylase carboxyl transferase subunit beta